MAEYDLIENAKTAEQCRRGIISALIDKKINKDGLKPTTPLPEIQDYIKKNLIFKNISYTLLFPLEEFPKNGNRVYSTRIKIEKHQLIQLYFSKCGPGGVSGGKPDATLTKCGYSIIRNDSTIFEETGVLTSPAMTSTYISDEHEVEPEDIIEIKVAALRAYGGGVTMGNIYGVVDGFLIQKDLD